MIVKAWGTWDLFQALLLTLRAIGDRHGRSIANIAVRWVLDHPFVGAVLVGKCFILFPYYCSPLIYLPSVIGARLGVSEHPADNRQVFGFRLTSEDNAAIENVLKHSNGRQIITRIGDCGAEYR